MKIKFLLTHQGRETPYGTRNCLLCIPDIPIWCLCSCSESRIPSYLVPYFTARNNHLQFDWLIFGNSKQFFDCLSVFWCIKPCTGTVWCHTKNFCKHQLMKNFCVAVLELRSFRASLGLLSASRNLYVFQLISCTSYQLWLQIENLLMIFQRRNLQDFQKRSLASIRTLRLRSIMS